MTRSDDQRLNDLNETAYKLAILVSKGKENFLSEFESQWAIERALHNIGEFCTHLSAEYKSLYPDIAWKEIIGMRTQLAHAYHQIDETIVWNAASVSVPALIRTLKRSNEKD